MTGIRVELVPHTMVAGGEALARTEDGRVVFVEGALPGERVGVDIVEQRRDFWRGVAVDIVEPSDHRVAPPCPMLADGCGGCQWQHVREDGQRALKEQIVRDALRRIAHIDDPPMGSTIALPAVGYRTTARFGVEPGGVLGFRRRHGHDLIDPRSCMVLHPSLDALLGAVRFPAAREVTLRTGERTGERLVFARPSAAGATVPDGVVVADHRNRGHYHEEAAGRRWRISAPSFFQARADGADALAAVVVGAAGPGDGRPAVDLYAGVGLFAGALVDAGWDVTAVEGVKVAAADARRNVPEAKIVHADVNAWRATTAETVVADPSRHGLGRAGADVVASTGAASVVLVSCDPAAMGRDAGLLRDRGYRLVTVTPVDLFPHTFHIEVISHWQRA